MSIITLTASQLLMLVSIDSYRVGGLCPGELSRLGNAPVYIGAESRNVYLAERYVRSLGQVSASDMKAVAKHAEGECHE